LRLFAQAREAAGTGDAVVEGDTVGQILDSATQQFGAQFEAVLASCRIWVNGEPASRDDVVGSTDEVAVLPPVSGGT
jgi:molybdopterin converting factor small subunit